MLTPLPYHIIATQYFKSHPRVWEFFRDASHKEEQLSGFKTELLKNTYKFDPGTDQQVYDKVNLAKEKLGMDCPVTVYQAQHEDEINASIVYLDKEAHIVFSGKMIQLLTDDELLAVIAHEMSHVQLYQQLGGEVEVTNRIVMAMGNHDYSTAAHYETARLFRLYTEIFCDRGAALVTGNFAPIVSSLVKLATGLQTVNADSYVKQAEEIFAAESSTRTSGISHPENFIRARAIALWQQQGQAAEEEIQKMIEGNTGLDELDLFRQKEITELSRKAVSLLVHPGWMQTSQNLALAKQYFSDLQPNNARPDTSTIASAAGKLHPSLQEYFSYILYDFTTADRSLEDLPVGLAFSIADELGLANAFAQVVKKEKKLSEKKVASLKKSSLAELAKLPNP